MIDAYSTSFGLATSLLPAETRTGIRSIYALVRVADEIVDGTAEEAGLDAEQQREVLDALESETLEALERGFSANLVVHAFAVAARTSSLEASLVTAFFASMRRDLEPVQSLSREEYSTYIYGSAEVVGLMCLRVFLMHETLTPEERADAEAGASSLGAAFQKVNFLRDLGRTPSRGAGRTFLGPCPGSSASRRRSRSCARSRRTSQRRAKPCRSCRPGRAGPPPWLHPSSGARGQAQNHSGRRAAEPTRQRAHTYQAAPAHGSSRGRSSRRPAMKRGRTETKSAIVIGGGFSGLATAALLAKDGIDVTVLEGRDTLGGRVGEWHEQGFRFETGPSWYLMPEVFDRFFEQMGTSTEAQLDLVTLDPAYRVFFEEDPDPFDLPDQGSLQALKALEKEPGSLDEYMRSAAVACRLATDRLLYSTYSSLKDFTDPALLRHLPRLLRLLAEPMERFISRHTSDSRVQKVLGYPAVFLGTSPKDAPSLYHLMSHLDINQSVLYPRGGFTAIVQAAARLAEDHGADVRTGCRVQHIAASKAVPPESTSPMPRTTAIPGGRRGGHQRRHAPHRDAAALPGAPHALRPRLDAQGSRPRGRLGAARGGGRASGAGAPLAVLH
ncbi:FAD-dependent oxidoreductase [Nesterenkonia pannonica]|uniref:FAD-dependent oxidoreductase n=1 Tax=Nesterenkonia pannonica TaxID=1548602 RepID=UPI002164D8B4|nr:FAD-dependent oxidoreductase [Nesterenkonia pannonica]